MKGGQRAQPLAQREDHTLFGPAETINTALPFSTLIKCLMKGFAPMSKIQSDAFIHLTTNFL